MDDQLEQWFLDAAGFSGTDLSMFIRMFAFFLMVIFCAIVIKGMIIEIPEMDTPMKLLPKLCILMVFATLMWSVLYV